jgi:methylated-DNA-[protein]-cysteine S-methyltransferase
VAPSLTPAAVVSLHTPLGELFVGASEDGIATTGFDQRSFIEELALAGHEAVVHGAPAEATTLARQARDQVAAYFAGTLRAFDVPIVLGAQTEFARAVLEEVAHCVGFGETVTYADIGERAGRLRAARAVGNILAACPFSVIVPCHRVVHAGRSDQAQGDGNGHFSHHKAWLLRFERDVIEAERTGRRS